MTDFWNLISDPKCGCIDQYVQNLNAMEEKTKLKEQMQTQYAKYSHSKPIKLNSISKDIKNETININIELVLPSVDCANLTQNLTQFQKFKEEICNDSIANKTKNSYQTILEMKRREIFCDSKDNSLYGLLIEIYNRKSKSYWYTCTVCIVQVDLNWEIWHGV